MPHVELSVSELNVARARQLPSPSMVNSGPASEFSDSSSLDRWSAAVAVAEEYCLILDRNAAIVAFSPALAHLLGLDHSALGRDLRNGVLGLVDFANGGELNSGELGKIPPLMALTSKRLARGLLRIQAIDEVCTLDAIATPLVDGEVTAGSLTFFSRV